MYFPFLSIDVRTQNILYVVLYSVGYTVDKISIKKGLHTFFL